jgi:5-methylcytosine-specific restriction protein A
MPTIFKPKRTEQKRIDRYDSYRRKIYQSQRWRMLRLAKLSDNPLCEMCATKGIVKPAVDVHHIVSFMTADDEVRRKALAYDYDNLMSLCKECHQFVHNSKGGMG